MRRRTFSGDFMGIPPTGKQIAFAGISVDGSLTASFVEPWGCADMLGLLQQLGAVPAAGGSQT